jgi:hypothetical protein
MQSVFMTRTREDSENPNVDGRSRSRIRALDPWAPSAGRMHQLLTDEERARLAVMSSIVRFKKGENYLREGDPPTQFQHPHGSCHSIEKHLREKSTLSLIAIKLL